MRRRRLLSAVAAAAASAAAPSAAASFGRSLPLPNVGFVDNSRSRRRVSLLGKGKRRQMKHGEHRHHSTNACRLKMIRNVDLPECVIFYGHQSVLDCGATACSVRPGVCRLLKECDEVGTPALLLTEHMTTGKLHELIRSTQDTNLRHFVDNGSLLVRSSLEECQFEPDHPYIDDEDHPGLYGLLGHAPSPAFLYDAVETIAMIPKGFGGSSGFGVKQEGVLRRPPLPKHCVVFVAGPDDRPTEESGLDVEAVSFSADGTVLRSNTVSRARCTAGKLSGMRVMYLEHDGLGTADAEDIADAIVPGLGDDDDWEIVTLDDIATPGSYWLNPPVARDEEGNRVNLFALCDAFQRARTSLLEGDSKPVAGAENGVLPDDISDSGGNKDMSEDEMAKILQDLDSL